MQDKLFSQHEAVAKVEGELKILDKTYVEIKIIPGILLADLKHHETAPAQCACYDPVKNVVYCIGAWEHNRLKDTWPEELYDNYNQERLNDLIYGFVTSGGYFVNRIQMSRLIANHRTVVRGRYFGEDEYFNSEMIQWRGLEDYLDYLQDEAKEAEGTNTPAVAQ